MEKPITATKQTRNRSAFSVVEILLSIAILGIMLGFIMPMYNITTRLTYGTSNPTPTSKVVYILRDMDTLYRGCLNYSFVKFTGNVPTETSISTAEGIAFEVPYIDITGTQYRHWITYQVTGDTITKHTWETGDATSTKEIIYTNGPSNICFQTELKEENWRNSTIPGYSFNVAVRSKYFQTMLPFFIPKD